MERRNLVIAVIAVAAIVLLLLSIFVFRGSPASPSNPSHLGEQSRRLAAGQKAVSINGFSYPGLDTIPVADAYGIACLAFQKDHHNKAHEYPLVGLVAGAKTAEQIYYTLYMAQVLVKPDGKVILSGAVSDSPALNAWNDLVADGIVKWDQKTYTDDGETWTVGTYAASDKPCVSSVVRDAILRYCNLTNSPVKYYATSKEREDEMAVSFKNDTSFTVTTTTAAIHAAVLHAMFPNMKIVIEYSGPAVDFLTRHWGMT